MQKSRSEEESVGFIIKESKTSVINVDKSIGESDKNTKEEGDSEGAQSKEIDTSDVTCDVTFVWQARSNETEDTKSTSKSETSTASSKFDWPDDDQELEQHRNNRKSDDENWNLTETDT